MSAHPVVDFAAPPVSCRPPSPPIEYMDTSTIEFSAGAYQDGASMIDRLRAEADHLFIEELSAEVSYDDDPDPFTGGEYFGIPIVDSSGT